MEFRHLRYFLALAEELHFGRAAQRLSISQPPLSLNIQQLEASVGAQLFTRNSRGVQLTAAGQAFVPAARALLAQAGAAMREAREVAQGQAGELQIGFAGTLLYCGLPQVLQRFQSSHPRLRLVMRELSSSEQLSELVRDRLDVGFVHTPRVPPGFEQILVASQAMVACLPQKHPLAKARSTSLQDLQGQALVVVSRWCMSCGIGSAWSRWWRKGRAWPWCPRRWRSRPWRARCLCPCRAVPCAMTPVACGAVGVTRRPCRTL